MDVRQHAASVIWSIVWVLRGENHTQGLLCNRTAIIDPWLDPKCLIPHSFEVARPQLEIYPQPEFNQKGTAFVTVSMETGGIGSGDEVNDVY